MCGVAGVVYLDGRPVSPVMLKRMTDLIAHRGPDGEGHWIEGNVGLGHRRLAIIDLSPAGRQPMLDSDQRFVLSYNGEIYNYPRAANSSWNRKGTASGPRPTRKSF